LAPSRKSQDRQNRAGRRRRIGHQFLVVRF
jgi:hypothetical protein